MQRVDLVIRRGTILDGTGAPMFTGDIALQAGRIASIGTKLDVIGLEEIDARDKLVTPGFVDIHTHYDGQVTWEDRVQPSSGHGVTTAVMGNCGVGFAPCRPEDRDRLVRLMEGVEDLPEPVLTAGLPWTWQSFGDYLDLLASRAYDIDIAAQLPHAAVRVNVMGQRAVDREAATPADIAAMATLARQAVLQGAIGFSTSRTLNHKGSDGVPTPTLTAAEDELTGIALALKAANRGVLQVISDFDDPDAELAMLERILVASGRPMSISLMQVHSAPDRWRRVLDWIGRSSDRGLNVRGQVCGRPVGRLLGFEISANPFSFSPTYRAIAGKPFAERLALLRQPEVRARIVTDQPIDTGDPRDARLRDFSIIFPLGDPPRYEPAPEDMVAARARAAGVTPEALAYDLLMADDGRGVLFLPSVNFAGGRIDAALEMMRHKDTVLGLGDGGAHLGVLCDAGLPTYMLTHWARDRTGDRLELPWLVKALSHDTARAVGLTDRGRLAVGMKADLNVIDFDRLALQPPRVAYDLPAGGRRVTQAAEGYNATVVSGVVTQRDGSPTDARPGRLVRAG